MKVHINSKQMMDLIKKLEDDPELAVLLPIKDDLLVLYERRKQAYLKSINCNHEWPEDFHKEIYPCTPCKYCGLQYHARNKKRDIYDFEKNYEVYIEIS